MNRQTILAGRYFPQPAPGRVESHGLTRSLVKTLALLVLVGSWLNGFHAWSVPFQKQVRFTQPDGTPIVLSGRGDEFYAVFETLDGYTVIFDPTQQAYFYAQLSGDRLLPSPLAVGQGDPAGLGLAKHLRVTPEAARKQALSKYRAWDAVTKTSQRWATRKAAQRAAGQVVPAGLAPPAGWTLGTQVGLCLLIDFAEVPASISQAEIVNFCNSDTYTGFGNNGSVKSYFYDNSNGRLTYTNIVTCYVRVPNPRSYYNNLSNSCDYAGNLLIRDALTVLKALTNYQSEILPTLNALTVDADHQVVAANVFFAGNNSGVWAYGLWPHTSALYSVGSQDLSNDGSKIVWQYQISNIGWSLEMATFCHENGHLLCDFPDLYDYGYDSTGGAGRFCLMGYGTYSAQNPSQICAYLKYKAGWATVAELTIASNLTATLTAGAGEAFNQFYRYGRPGVPTEYFLLENRQPAARDAQLPGAGVAIWHVDELGYRDDQRMAPNAYHQNYELTLVQADNQWHFEANVNKGDANDLYYAGNTAAGYTNAFTDFTAPKARWWDGSRSGVNFNYFSSCSNTMTFEVSPGEMLAAPRLSAEPAVTPGPDNTIAWNAVAPSGGTSSGGNSAPAPQSQTLPAKAPAEVLTGAGPAHLQLTAKAAVTRVPFPPMKGTKAASAGQFSPPVAPLGMTPGGISWQTIANGGVTGTAEPVLLPQGTLEASSAPLPLAAPQVLVSEGFEDALTNGLWRAFSHSTLSGRPYWGVVTVTNAYAGTNAIWCAGSSMSPAESYTNYMQSWLVYGPFSLSLATNASLDFYYQNYTDPLGDSFIWSYSTNGAAFIPCGYVRGTNDSSWRLGSLDLAPVLGQSQVWIGFEFDSGTEIPATNQYTGTFIDEVNIQVDLNTNQPDLLPSPPGNWREIIPIGTNRLYGTDAHITQDVYYENQELYLNLASWNQGAVASGGYNVHLEVEGTGGGAWDLQVPSHSAGSYLVLAQDEPVGPLAAGSHKFKLRLDNSNSVAEVFEGNNYYERTINVLSCSNTVFLEDFEDFSTNELWQAYSLTTGRPYWGVTTNGAFSGTHSLWCAGSAMSPASGYTNNMDSWLVYGPFSLAIATNASLSFYYKNLSEKNLSPPYTVYDTFYWGFATDTNLLLMDNYQSVGGDQNTWRLVTMDLTPVLGEPQVWVAFYFASDSSNCGDVGYTGAFVDQVSLHAENNPNNPDLAPFQPTNWNDMIAIGTNQLNGTDPHNYTGFYYDNQVLYFNVASWNRGAVSAGGYTVHVEVTGAGGGSSDLAVPNQATNAYWFCPQDQPVGPLGAGIHTVKLWTDSSNEVTEVFEGNNYYERTIVVLSTNAVLAEDFEGSFPNGSWAAFTTTNGIPYWGVAAGEAYSGTHSAWCAGSSRSPEAGYTNNMEAWLVYGPVDLRYATWANFTFFYKNDSEPWYDFFYWVYSTDGSNFTGIGVTGNQNTWRLQTMDLAPVLGEPRVWVGLVFSSDASGAGDYGYTGAFVDQAAWDLEWHPIEYYAECADNPEFAAPRNSGWITNTSHTFTSLAPGQTNWFRVKARHGTNNLSGWSNVEFSRQVANPMLTWLAPADLTYGAALGSSQLNATATFDSTNVNGTFTYNPTNGTVLSAGAAQPLAVTFTPADTNTLLPVTSSVLINVNPAPLTITANSASRVYGQTNPVFTASYSGFQNGETLSTSGVTGSPSLTTTATETSPVPGPYPITAAVGTLVAGNYSFSFVDGQLTIAKATTLALVNSSSNPALPGTSVTFTAVLNAVPPGSGTPSGTVSFLIDGVVAGSNTLSGGSAAFTTNALTHGAHTVVAGYPGDGNFIATTNQMSLDQVINTPPVAGAVTIARNPAQGVKVLIATLLANDSDADGDTITFVGASATSTNGGTVSSSGSWLFYAPLPGDTNADTFAYAIGDGYGTGTNWVTVSIHIDAGSSSNLTITDLGNGSYAIYGDGIPNYTYRIFFADDTLGTDWQPLGTATANAVGFLEFIHTAEAPHRYYRSVYP